jgi:general secretion pathway protein F
MANFTVRRLRAGQIEEVLIDADNAQAARQAAAKSDARVLSVKERRQRLLFGKGLGMENRQILLTRLASMLASRLGASEALEVIEHSFSGSIREAARLLREGLVRGDMAQAMRHAGPRYFPESIVAIVHTGARGGDLAFALREAARFERELASVQKDSRKGMFSALAGFLTGVAVLLASTLWVAPEIMNSSFVTASNAADIGWVMAMARGSTWAAGAGGVLLAFLLLTAGIRPLAPTAVDRLVLRIPFYRDMVLAKSNYLVFFGLGVLLKAGLRVEEALTLSWKNAPRGELKNDLQRAIVALTKGGSKPWPYAMRLLHPTDRAALAVAQDREQVAGTIEGLALQYQQLYRSRLATFIPAMQMLAAVFLSIAGFVLFAVSIIPLLQGSSAILTAM